jgi:HPt (histidine-containing phosphotransfer) domain-containing protein
MTQNESKLDLELLDEMAKLGIDDLRELIEAYVEQATETMQQLLVAIDAKKADDVAELAHRLAGSCGVCGATSAMNTLRMLERHGCEANWPAIERRFTQAVREVELSGWLLGEYLKEKNQTLCAAFAPPAMAQMLHS